MAKAATLEPAAQNGVAVSNRDAFEAYLQLRDALERAFDAAMEIDDIRRIGRAMHAVTNEILRLNAAEIAKAGEAYKPTLEDLATAVEDLKHIRDNIRQISSSIKTIAEVIAAIAKVATFLPL